jgi:hypothetical protein
MGCMESRSTHLSTWVSAALKERFATAAVLQGLSESALLKRLVEQMLAGAGGEFANVDRPIPIPIPIARDARVTVRLVPDDSFLLRERAAARGMPAATYVSSLVRAHLRSAVTQLSAIGRNLNAMARTALAGGTTAAPTQAHLLQMLRVCDVTLDHVKALMQANIVSWEAGYDKKSR